MMGIGKHFIGAIHKACLVFAALQTANYLPALHGEDNMLTQAEVADGWTLLFNGKDLSEWKGSAEIWSVSHGAISLTNTKEHRARGDLPLIWQGGKFSDFELKYTAKAQPNEKGKPLTCWFLFRANIDPLGTNIFSTFEQDVFNEWHSGSFAWHPWGRKFKILDSGDPKKPTFQDLGLHGNADDVRRAFKMDDWNAYKVIASGNHLRFFVDEKEITDVIDERNDALKEGHFGLKIYFASTPGVVLFKDIKLKDLTMKPALTGSGQLKTLSEQFLNAKEWVLARLDLAVPGEVSDQIAALKAALTAESALNAQDKDAQNLYKTGASLCEAMSAILKTREVAYQASGGDVVRAPSIDGIRQWDRSAKIYSEQLGAYYVKFVGALTARGAKQFIVSANAPRIAFPPFTPVELVSQSPSISTPIPPEPRPKLTPAPPPPPSDPIVGRWRLGQTIIIFSSDGSFENAAPGYSEKGRWKCLSTSSPAKYRINWSGGRRVEDYYVSGNELKRPTYKGLVICGNRAD